MAVTSLLELIERLLTDGDAAAAFREAPDRFLSDQGLDDLSGADVIDALSLGFDSVAPDLAGRLVLPAESDDASAADAFAQLLDAAPAESVLDEARVDLDFDFGLGLGLGHDSGGSAFGDGDSDSDSDMDFGNLGLGLDVEADMGSVDDLDTATFDQGFGSGSGDLDVDGLHDLDDLGFDADDHHHHHDPDHGPDGLH